MALFFRALQHTSLSHSHRYGICRAGQSSFRILDEATCILVNASSVSSRYLVVCERCLELQSECQLAGAGTTDLVQRVKGAVEVILCISDFSKVWRGKVITEVCRRRREHGMVERIEILDTHIQGDSVG